MTEKPIIVSINGQEVIRLTSKGKMAIARYPNMLEGSKNYIVDLVVKLSGKDRQEIVDFLNYTNEENEFCS